MIRPKPIDVREEIVDGKPVLVKVYREGASAWHHPKDKTLAKVTRPRHVGRCRNRHVVASAREDAVNRIVKNIARPVGR